MGDSSASKIVFQYFEKLTSRIGYWLCLSCKMEVSMKTKDEWAQLGITQTKHGNPKKSDSVGQMVFFRVFVFISEFLEWNMFAKILFN